MPKTEEFPFERARSITEKEVTTARKAIEKKLGVKRTPRGRRPKGDAKFRPISIRLHPKILEWAKKEAKRLGTGYQTVINSILLKRAMQS